MIATWDFTLLNSHFVCAILSLVPMAEAQFCREHCLTLPRLVFDSSPACKSSMGSVWFNSMGLPLRKIALVKNYGVQRAEHIWTLTVSLSFEAVATDQNILRESHVLDDHVTQIMLAEIREFGRRRVWFLARDTMHNVWKREWGVEYIFIFSIMY